MGLFDSLFGSKQKSKNSFDPYAPTQDFLLGNNGQPGIFDEAARLYGQGGFLPSMQEAQTDYLSQLGARGHLPQNILSNIGQLPGQNPAYAAAANDLMGGAYAVANGAYDTNFNPVANINIPQVDLTSARAGQGALDPTRSLSSLLTGNVVNPYLQQQSDAMVNQLTRNLNENVMPGIRSEALASGQYGGSRQGIAEGLAASRLNQDLAPALTNLFGGAFENAQQRMAGTANALNEQAFQNAANNANLSMGGQQFNANLGLQNNAQQMARNQANLGNRMQAINIANASQGLLSGDNALRAQQLGLQSQQLQNLGMGMGLQDQNFAQRMAALGMPQDINAQNLQNYQNVIFPGATLGGTSRGTQTQSPGIIPAALGTISGIAGIGRGLGMLGGAR